jgi:hypothetical protein
MIYKFKSKADGDLVMLEPNGRQILDILGKTTGAHGIILPAEIPGAISALEAAIVQDNAARRAATAEAKAHEMDSVSLQQRAKPFITMLQRCAKDNVEIVW